MSKTWILISDAARARLFELPRKNANLVEIACYTCADARSPGQHPAHGRLSRTHESTTPSRHAIEPRTTLRAKHAKQFAATLGHIVERGRLEGRYDNLVLMAPPRFLGTLRACLNQQTLNRVISEVDSDLLTLSPAELRMRLSA